MTVASLRTIRNALRVVINSIDGLVVYDKVPDAGSMPAVVIQPRDPGINYIQTYQSKNADWNLALIVLAGRANETAAQDIIDDYISPDGNKSIPKTIDENHQLAIEVGEPPVLTPQVDYAVCQTLSRYGLFKFNEVSYLGAQIDVEVRA